MPKPNPRRDVFLKFLRQSFPHKLDLELEGVTYPYAQVKDAVYGIRDNDPLLMRVLTSYLFTNMSRARSSDMLAMDPSTFKRRLDLLADLICQKLNHGDFPAADLFRVHDPRDNSIVFQAFPKTVFRDD
jgi:hypothetical protein